MRILWHVKKVMKKKKRKDPEVEQDKTYKSTET